MAKTGPMLERPDMSLADATVAERYRIIDIVGRGGMGVVYRCEDLRLHGRPCALKVVSGQPDPVELARFEREIHTVSQLRSAHSVQIFDCGRLPDGRPYIVMELLEGRGLDVKLREGPLLPEEAALVAEQILTALVEAHALEIVHRDLKPANVYLVVEGDAEIVKVLDFGIAKQIDAQAPELTHRDMAMGTPRYMAPEQFTQREASARSDLYAVGVVVFEMLTGRQPFHEDDPVPESLALMPARARLAWMHLNREPPAIDGISHELSAWLARMLSKDPAERFEGALAAREALRHTAELASPSSSRTAIPSGLSRLRSGPAPRGPRLHVPILIGLLVGLVGLVGLGLLVERRPAAVGDPAAPVADHAGSPAEPVALCRHAVDTLPPSAALDRAGQALGRAPLVIERPCDEGWTVEARLEGHIAQTIELSGPGGALTIELTPEAPPEPEPVDAGPVDAGPADAAAPPPSPRRAVTRRKPARPPAPRPRPPAPPASPPAVEEEPARPGPLLF